MRRTRRRNSERVIPWEVGSKELDPVTTDRPSGREIAINRFGEIHGRDQTPASDQVGQGEGIVCASGNGGVTRSSDLHEWRNDLGAVSTRDPVKL
jgi:hypothetical protein